MNAEQRAICLMKNTKKKRRGGNEGEEKTEGKKY